MSMIRRQQSETVPGPGVVVRARTASRRLLFRWSISPGAAHAAKLCPRGVRSVSLELALDVTRRRPAPRATAAGATIRHDGIASPLPLARASGPVTTDPKTGLMHIDIDGVVHATLRRGGEVLYARTPLLARLGLPGGRYECEGLDGGGP